MRCPHRPLETQTLSIWHICLLPQFFPESVRKFNPRRRSVSHTQGRNVDGGLPDLKLFFSISNTRRTPTCLIPGSIT